MDITDQYNLRPNRSNVRDRYADHYTVPVVLTNLSIPKAMKLYEMEAPMVNNNLEKIM